MVLRCSVIMRMPYSRIGTTFLFFKSVLDGIGTNSATVCLRFRLDFWVLCDDKKFQGRRTLAFVWYWPAIAIRERCVCSRRPHLWGQAQGGIFSVDRRPRDGVSQSCRGHDDGYAQDLQTTIDASRAVRRISTRDQRWPIYLFGCSLSPIGRKPPAAAHEATGQSPRNG